MDTITCEAAVEARKPAILQTGARSGTSHDHPSPHWQRAQTRGHPGDHGGKTSRDRHPPSRTASRRCCGQKRATTSEEPAQTRRSATSTTRGRCTPSTTDRTPRPGEQHRQKGGGVPAGLGRGAPQVGRAEREERGEQCGESKRTDSPILCLATIPSLVGSLSATVPPVPPLCILTLPALLSLTPRYFCPTTAVGSNLSPIRAIGSPRDARSTLTMLMRSRLGTRGLLPLRRGQRAAVPTIPPPAFAPICAARRIESGGGRRQ